MRRAEIIQKLIIRISETLRLRTEDTAFNGELIHKRVSFAATTSCHSRSNRLLSLRGVHFICQNIQPHMFYAMRLPRTIWQICLRTVSRKIWLCSVFSSIWNAQDRQDLCVPVPSVASAASVVMLG